MELVGGVCGVYDTHKGITISCTGTDATIADHIKKILDREYAYKNSQLRFVPSTLGVGLVEAYDEIGLDVSLSKPFLRREVRFVLQAMRIYTAVLIVLLQMEISMKKICDGVLTKPQVVNEAVRMYSDVFEKVNCRTNVLISSIKRSFDSVAQR